jgi:hypothetical protein
MNLAVTVEQVSGPTGQPEIRIVLKDDGNGMDARTLERFFNLGDSEKSELKAETEIEDHPIGEKGFGTKIYLNSRRVEVRTRDKKSGIRLRAVSQGHTSRKFTMRRVVRLPSMRLLRKNMSLTGRRSRFLATTIMMGQN